MARSSLQKRRRADNRQEILEAAGEIVSRDGSGAMTLSAVAAQVGVTTPALYHYFDSKEALLQALMESWIRDETDMLVETAAGWEGDEAGLLGGIVRAMYDYYRPNLPTFRLVYFHWQIAPPSSVGMDSVFIERLHPYSRRMFDALQSVLERGQAAGTVSPRVDPRTAVVAAHAAAVGLLTMLALADRAGDPLRQGDETLLGALSELLLLGVRAR